VYRDHELVGTSLEYLISIFTDTLTVAFEEARRPVASVPY
jgi:hypothetical protein